MNPKFGKWRSRTALPGTKASGLPKPSPCQSLCDILFKQHTGCCMSVSLTSKDRKKNGMTWTFETYCTTLMKALTTQTGGLHGCIRLISSWRGNVFLHSCSNRRHLHNIELASADFYILMADFCSFLAVVPKALETFCAIFKFSWMLSMNNKCRQWVESWQ